MRDAKIKVVWLCTPLSWPGGGTLRYMTNWAKYMDWDRFEVALILGGPDPGHISTAKQDFEALGLLQVTYLEGLYPVSRWLTGGLQQLRQCLRTLAPDILHTIFIQSDIAGGLVRRRAGVPVHMSSLMGALVPWFTSPLKRLLYRFGYARIRDQLNAIVAVSQAAGDGAVHDFGAPLDRMHVIYSSVDLREFQFKSGWPYVSTQQARVVGMIARLSLEKIPDLFVSAAPHVLERCPEVRFVVAGSGPEEGNLNVLAQELGVSERFEFMGWTNRVAATLQTFDTFVFVSKFDKFEGLPSAVLEAQAVGVPTIASAASGVPEVIQDGRNGLLLKRNEPEELAEKIVWMLEHRELAAEMGIAGRRAVESHFNIEREALELQALYESLYSCT